jgi:hypothetical protein
MCSPDRANGSDNGAESGVQDVGNINESRESFFFAYFGGATPLSEREQRDGGGKSLMDPFNGSVAKSGSCMALLGGKGAMTWESWFKRRVE